MKKFLAIIAIASFAVACNSKGDKKVETPVDTAAAKMDTAAAKMDTAAAKMDTAAAKMDTAAKPKM